MMETFLQDARALPGIVTVAGLILFWIWESGAPAAATDRRVRHAARNLAIAGLNGAVIALALAALTVVTTTVVEQRGWGLVQWMGSSFSALAAGFLLLDLWMYAWHRLNHRIPFLWRFHRMHHSDPDMDVSTATRFHLGEITLANLVRLGIIVALGLPLALLIAYDAVLIAVTQFHHSNIRLAGSVDRAIRYLIVSPHMHRVHHSQFQPETDSNYSSVFSVWDRLFGSYRQRTDYSTIRFGLSEFNSGHDQTILGMLMTPFTDTSTRQPDLAAASW